MSRDPFNGRLDFQKKKNIPSMYGIFTYMCLIFMGSMLINIPFVPWMVWDWFRLGALPLHVDGSRDQKETRGNP